jgi:hypothetical protein
MCESKSWALADLRELPHTTYVVPEIHHAPANHKANRSTLRSWSGGAVRINQITCIRSELLYPAKALPPDSLESPISCSPQPQHGKSTSTLNSVCQACIRLSLLDSSALRNSSDTDLHLWIFDVMPHPDFEAGFQPLHRDTGARYGDLVCQHVPNESAPN